jgi:hypothetical protein
VGTGAHRTDVSGTFRIQKGAEGYRGALTTSLGPDAQVDEVIAGGNRLWIHAGVPDGDPIELALQIEGATLRGRFIAGFGNNRPLVGRRLEEKRK